MGISPSPDPIARLRAARRSHCHTCGCSRCHRIDQLLEQVKQTLESHPEETGPWLIEGRLLNDDKGNWFIRSGEKVTPLSECLYPWDGYQVVIIIGPDVAHASDVISSPPPGDHVSDSI